MRQSAIVIHRGKRDERYEICVEDYVISFLKERKEKENLQETSGILFYGHREKDGRKYVIYGAGENGDLELFDKYEPLQEIDCRLTEADPVFLVREKDGFYEVKGYGVFYYENTEMQDYLIRRGEAKYERKAPDTPSAGMGQAVSDRRGEGTARKNVQNGRKTNPQYAVSLQLGLVFLVLVAIVINSANSYDKMEELNRSAREVFFVMENQEAEGALEEAGVENAEENTEVDMAMQADALTDLQLQENVQQENARADTGTGADASEEASMETTTDAKVQTEKGEDDTVLDDGQTDDAEDDGQRTVGSMAEKDEETEGEVRADSGEKTTAIQDETVSAERESAADGEGVEALSRNVARYYEIKRGDTLYRISQKIYGDVSQVKKICELNEITDPDNIHYGQKIILP